MRALSLLPPAPVSRDVAATNLIIESSIFLTKAWARPLRKGFFPPSWYAPGKPMAPDSFLSY